MPVEQEDVTYKTTTLYAYIITPRPDLTYAYYSCVGARNYIPTFYLSL